VRIRRKSFFPTLLLAILFWFGWGWLVYSTAPTNSFLLIAFFFLLFMAFFLTAALVFANSRRGFLIGVGIICFLIFRYYQIGNILNVALLLGIFLCLELYLGGR